MINLFFLVMIIVSIFKPEAIISKKAREYGTEEQLKRIAKNIRKILVIIIVSSESMSFMEYLGPIGLIVAVLLIVLFLVIAIPAIKDNERNK